MLGEYVISALTAPPSSKYLFAYGQAVSRAAYATLMAGITISEGVTATSSSPTLTGSPTRRNPGRPADRRHICPDRHDDWLVHAGDLHDVGQCHGIDYRRRDDLHERQWRRRHHVQPARLPRYNARRSREYGRHAGSAIDLDLLQHQFRCARSGGRLAINGLSGLQPTDAVHAERDHRRYGKCRESMRRRRQPNSRQPSAGNPDFGSGGE